MALDLDPADIEFLRMMITVLCCLGFLSCLFVSISFFLRTKRTSNHIFIFSMSSSLLVLLLFLWLGGYPFGNYLSENSWFCVFQAVGLLFLIDLSCLLWLAVIVNFFTLFWLGREQIDVFLPLLFSVLVSSGMCIGATIADEWAYNGVFCFLTSITSRVVCVYVIMIPCACCSIVMLTLMLNKIGTIPVFRDIKQTAVRLSVFTAAYFLMILVNFLNRLWIYFNAEMNIGNWILVVGSIPVLSMVVTPIFGTTPQNMRAWRRCCSGRNQEQHEASQPVLPSVQHSPNLSDSDGSNYSFLSRNSEREYRGVF
eukprot:Lithocolla_globosa_v1_NODE_1604_length_2454_cov_5.560233.p1 type:complete len:311 gc:universal NODE_1604_length_2454_cov_5.560233:1786-854(-)